MADAVSQKTTKSGKAIILQLKINKFKKLLFHISHTG